MEHFTPAQSGECRGRGTSPGGILRCRWGIRSLSTRQDTAGRWPTRQTPALKFRV